MIVAVQKGYGRCVTHITKVFVKRTSFVVQKAPQKAKSCRVAAFCSYPKFATSLQPLRTPQFQSACTTVVMMQMTTETISYRVHDLYGPY